MVLIDMTAYQETMATGMAGHPEATQALEGIR